MKHSTGKPTKAEAERMRRISQMLCIACRAENCSSAPTSEVHHLLSGNKRRGHLFTVPLCCWHHRGIFKAPGFTRKEIESVYGPSLALSPKAFRAKYGSDEVLLRATNELLGVSP